MTHINRRANSSSARSTILMARSTPAQTARVGQNNGFSDIACDSVYCFLYFHFPDGFCFQTVHYQQLTTPTQMKLSAMLKAG